MKDDKKLKSLTDSSEVFQNLLHGFQYACESTAENLFAKLADILIEKKIVSRCGKPQPNRDSSLAYLEMVLPLMTIWEFDILADKPEEFLKRFLFVPSERKKSLITFLQKNEIIDNNCNVLTTLTNWGINLDEVFQSFREEYNLSPFEIVEDMDILPDFWETTTAMYE